MINIKEHIKLTGLYAFFAAFPAVLQLIVYPIIEGTERLGAEDFGYLAIAEAIISFLVMFCLFGMAISISRFYFDYIEDKRGYKQLLSTVYTGIILRSLLVLVVIFLFADYLGAFFTEASLSDFRSYGFYLLIIAFNRTVIAVSLALYRNEKKIQSFIIVSLISGIARSLMQIIGVLYFDLSFVGYLMGTAIGGGIVSFSIVIYTYSHCGFHFSKSIIKHLRRFSISLFFADIVWWGILFFDRFMLVSNPGDLGIYDNALKFSVGIQFISQGLASSTQPELFRFLNEGFAGSQNEVKTLSNLFIAENIAIVAIFLLPVMIFINLFYETSLILSTGILALVFLRYILYAQAQVFLWPVLYLKKSNIYLGLNILVLGILILCNFLLVPHFGYYGSIAATLIAGIGQVIFFYLAQKKLFGIKWNKVKVLIFPFVVILFVVAIEYSRTLFNIGMYITAALSTVFIFLGLTFIYRNEIKAIINKYLLIKIKSYRW